MGMAGPILSHTHKTLENYLFSIDEQMILLSFLHISYQKLANLEKPIFSLYSRPLTVENPSNSTVSGLELREKVGFSKFSNFWLVIERNGSNIICSSIKNE